VKRQRTGRAARIRSCRPTGRWPPRHGVWCWPGRTATYRSVVRDRSSGSTKRCSPSRGPRGRARPRAGRLRRRDGRPRRDHGVLLVVRRRAVAVPPVARSGRPRKRGTVVELRPGRRSVRAAPGGSGRVGLLPAHAHRDPRRVPVLAAGRLVRPRAGQRGLRRAGPRPPDARDDPAGPAPMDGGRGCPRGGDRCLLRLGFRSRRGDLRPGFAQRVDGLRRRRDLVLRRDCRRGRHHLCRDPADRGTRRLDLRRAALRRRR
jgi:hypothetical protein